MHSPNTQTSPEKEWIEKESDEDLDIDEYDLTSTPNDFNTLTLVSFIESGAVKIPGFQRHYVWDIRRASKLIESIILGLPVPQIFLYEESRNNFLVIDGQQRLMSLYFFVKGRFPKKDKRTAIRGSLGTEGHIPAHILEDDSKFSAFDLKITTNSEKQSKFKKLKYATLGEYKTQFDLRPIRAVIIRQNHPSEDQSSIYEIFNRLNSGGINLHPQEIRSSLYHSNFYDTLQDINNSPAWRKTTGRATPDLHMKDIEVLLRGFAMLINGDEYKPSMAKFLNKFSHATKSFPPERNKYLEDLLMSFLSATEAVSFINSRTKKFSVALFESVLSASCRQALSRTELCKGQLSQSEIDTLNNDPHFAQAAKVSTTDKNQVRTRLQRGATLVTSL